MFPSRTSRVAIPLWRALFAMIVCLAALPLGGALAQDGKPTWEPPSGAFLDVDWYGRSLVATVDRWNGGLDGESGAGVYADNFDGFFDVNLSRDWQRTRPGGNTAIAHSRAIYINAEAYRAAGPDEGARFLRAVRIGADYLLEHFWDTEYGGFVWEVDVLGRVKDDRKQDYANVHPLLALAHAYAVTGDARYLDGALTQLEVIERHFLDPEHSGGFLPGFNRDFTRSQGVNNVDSFTHYFEALLALYDVTGGEMRARIADKIVLEGDFLASTLYVDQDGFEDRGYVAYNYDDVWQPSQQPYSRDTQWSGAMHASTGHGVELAYLISRAVERGFNPEWLHVADRLLRFCVEYALHPELGGMIYEITDYDGQPLPGNPDNPYFVWWAQGETARALLHFAVVRGRDDFAGPFLKVQDLIVSYLTDHEYGGWVQNLDEMTLVPTGYAKGDIWNVHYHFAMLHSEVLRLAAEYPERVEALNREFSGELALSSSAKGTLRVKRQLP